MCCLRSLDGNEAVSRLPAYDEQLYYPAGTSWSSVIGYLALGGSVLPIPPRRVFCQATFKPLQHLVDISSAAIKASTVIYHLVRIIHVQYRHAIQHQTPPVALVTPLLASSSLWISYVYIGAERALILD